MQKVMFAGLEIAAYEVNDLLPECGKFKHIVTVNADFVVQAKTSKRFRNIISRSYSTLDGQITFWLAKIFARPGHIKLMKISGSSLVYDLFGFAKHNNKRVFLLGASDEVNERAKAVVAKLFGVEVQGYSPPLSEYPFSLQLNAEILCRISAFEPHIILVAFGAPKQEFWIDDNSAFLQSLGVQLAIGCGGSLEFVSGAIPRAPKWVQNSGLEWAYRLIKQPAWFRVKRIMRSMLVMPLAFHHFLLGR